MKMLPEPLLKALVITALTTSAFTLSSTHAQEATNAAPSLAVGSAIPALEGITWIQGEPIEALNAKGKVYMLELWATWCGPCVQIIPHVNEWHQKYQAKGLEIVGMNVFEDDIDTVKSFVTAQGENMSYRVAFSGGKGSKFETNWLRPAGIESIPHALLLKDGKIIFKGHPGMLKEETLEAMLGDDFDAEKYAAEIAAEEKKEQELRDKVTPLFQAQDWDGIIKLAEELDDSNPAKLQLMLTAVSQKADWKALAAIREKVASDTESAIPTSAIDENAALGMAAGEGAKEYAVLALKDMPAVEGAAEQQVPALIAKARLQFLAEGADPAKSTLAQVKELSQKIENPQFKAQIDQLIPAIQKALKDNSFPSLQELMQGQ